MIVWDVFEKNNNNRLCVAGTVEVTKNCREKAEKSYFLAWQKNKSNNQILTVDYNYFSNQIKVIVHMCINFILIIIKKSNGRDICLRLWTTYHGSLSGTLLC